MIIIISYKLGMNNNIINIFWVAIDWSYRKRSLIAELWENLWVVSEELLLGKDQREFGVYEKRLTYGRWMKERARQEISEKEIKQAEEKLKDNTEKTRVEFYLKDRSKREREKMSDWER